MKKVLFATTALVATAGVAAADVSLSGAAEAMLRDYGVAGGDSYIETSVELDVSFSGTTDSGLSFGATMDIDTGANGTTGTSADPEIFVTGAFGTIMIGNLTYAADGIGLAEVGDSAGADDTLEGLRGTVDDAIAADVSWKYTIEGLTLTLSTEVGGTADAVSTGEGDFSLHAAYTMAGLTVEVGFADDNSTGDSWSGLELGYKMGDATLGATFINRDEAAGSSVRDRSGAGFSIGYAVNDALSVTGVMSTTDGVAAGSQRIDDNGVGFAYNLGGGASIVGGMAETNTVDRWDFGIKMSF